MADAILEHATFEVERELRVRADDAVLQFLIDHPDFAAAVHRGLGLDRFQVRAEGWRYQITHGYARGTFWVTERQLGRVAYLASGAYEHPMLRAMGIRLRARSFVVTTFNPDPAEAQTSEVRVRIHGYLQISNSVLGPVLQSFGPLVRQAFESKLTAAHRIAPELSEKAFREREDLLEAIRQIQGLDPSRLDEFEALVGAQPPFSPPA